MSIRYLPSRILSRTLPEKRIKKLITQRLTLNRAVLASLTDTGFLKEKTMSKIALKVLKGYRSRYEDAKDEGASAEEAKDEALNQNKLLIQRVQNAAVFEISKEIKEKYHGEFYEWLPSDAEEPDPLHQLNYGQTFQLGSGEQPGDRYGCRCGMNILVDETRLSI